jgi:hypothetical protein
MNARKLIVITGLVTATSLAPSAWATSGCTNSYLSGNYVMQLAGVSGPGIVSSIGGLAIPPNTTAQPQATGSNAGGNVSSVVGTALLALDGSGNITGYSAANIGGQWLQGNLTGTYAVNFDCTFSLALTDGMGNLENYSGVMVNQATSGLILQTDAGTGVSGTFSAARTYCQTTDLFGAFGIQYTGSAAKSPFSSVGVMTFDGQGNVTTVESRFTQGSSSQVQSAGTVTVNQDCSFNVSLSSPSVAGGTMNLFGIADADYKHLHVIQSDANTAVSGVLSSQ